MVPACLWARGCHCHGAASTPPLASHMGRGSAVFSEALGGSQAWDFRTFLPGQAAQGLGEVPAPFLRSSKPALSLPQLNLAQEPGRNLPGDPGHFLYSLHLVASFYSYTPPIPQPLPYLFSFIHGWVLVFGRVGMALNPATSACPAPHICQSWPQCLGIPLSHSYPR